MKFRFALAVSLLTMTVACASGDAPPRRTIEAPATRGFDFVALARGPAVFARNDAQGFAIRVEGSSVGVQVGTTDAGWSMQLVSAGRSDAMSKVHDEAPTIDGNVVRYARLGGLTEWFVNDARGLEQGFTFAHRPSGSGTLRVELAIAGSLVPSLDASGETVRGRDESGRTVLWYGALHARDANGRELPARFALDGRRLRVDVDDTVATYPVEIDPLTWGQQAKLLPSDPAADTQFGGAVAISGGTVVVGAQKGNAAYVFIRSGGSWTQQAKLEASDKSAGDAFGASVAIAGDTVLVGARKKGGGYGGAYVFVRSGTTWSEQAKLSYSGKPSTGDEFGTAVAVVGDLAMVGGPGIAAADGVVVAFQRTGTTWVEAQIIGASDAATRTGDQFGATIALQASRMVVGAPVGSTGRGRAYILEPDTGGKWNETRILTAPAPDDADNTYFGRGVAVSGESVAVGMASFAVGVTSGVHVWTHAGSIWKYQAKLLGLDTVSADQLGRSVALEGDTLVAGSLKGAYVFTRAGAVWSQLTKLVGSDTSFSSTSFDEFGNAVSLSGDAIAVGAFRKASDAGAAYVFRFLSANGDACSSALTCLSNFCTDGVCCDKACTGQCEACDGTVGTCTTVVGKPHGSRSACAGDGSDCGQRACDGVDATKCNFPTATKPCGVAACTSGIETHVGKCDGAGKCDDVAKPCGAFKCGLIACGTSCLLSSECADGYYCKASTCVPLEGLGTPCSVAAPCGTGLFCTDGFCCGKSACDTGSTCGFSGKEGTCTKSNGTKCAIDLECGSGHCVDGVCCDTACGGQCEACDASGSVGKCTPISGDPHGIRATCDAGGGDVCKAASCDGAKDTTKCVGFENGTTTRCKDATCSGTTFTAASTCDGLGGCKAPPSTACIPYVCEATGCRKSCESDAHCDSKFKCVKGECVEGARCTPDFSASIGKDGSTTPCAPYRCGSDGKCKQGCATADDCAPDYSCDPDMKSCEKGSSATDSSGGCGCSQVRGDGALDGLAAIFVLAVLAKRRRVVMATGASSRP